MARTLGEDGYAGVEVRVTPIRTEIIIRATRTREVLGEKGRRIRELTALVQKRFGFPEPLVFAAKNIIFFLKHVRTNNYWGNMRKASRIKEIHYKCFLYVFQPSEH